MSRSLLFFALVALCCFVGVQGQQQPTWQLCPSAPTDITIVHLDLSLIGRNLSYVMTATVDEQLTTGSTITVNVNLDGGQIYSENLDMASGTTLPIPANSQFVYHYGIVIPSIAPSGSYTVDVIFQDQNANPLTCIAISFNLAEEKKIAEF